MEIISRPQSKRKKGLIRVYKKLFPLILDSSLVFVAFGNVLHLYRALILFLVVLTHLPGETDVNAASKGKINLRSHISLIRLCTGKQKKCS